MTPIRRLVPRRLRLAARRARRPVRFGSLRTTTPASDHWGRDRGTPIDRWYLEAFLAEQAGAIRGHALEVRDPGYVKRFGHGLTTIDVVDIDPANAEATIVGDLTEDATLRADAFDAMVVTQVLQYVTDVPAALKVLGRALAPGGTLILSVPGIARIGRADIGIDFWRYTPAGFARILHDAFGDDPALSVTVDGRGNVLTAVAFVAGAAAEDLSRAELVIRDDAFPLIVLATVRRS